MASVAVVSGLLGLAGLAWGAWQLSRNARLSGNWLGKPLTAEEVAKLTGANKEQGNRTNGEGFAQSAEQAKPLDDYDNSINDISKKDFEILASNGNSSGLAYWDNLYKDLFGVSAVGNLLGVGRYGTGTSNATGEQEQPAESEQKKDNDKKKNDKGGILSNLALKVLNTLLGILGTVIKYSLKFIWLIFAFIIYKMIIKDKK